MTFGDLEGRLLLALVPLAFMLVLEVIVPELRAVVRRFRTPADLRPDEPVRAAVPAATASPALPPPKPAVVPRPVSEEVAPEAPAAGEPKEDVQQTEADALWEAACEMEHQFIPDWETDEAYLTLLYKAAALGQFEALNRLGDYALLREAFVEAFYWKIKVAMEEAPFLGATLEDVLAAWTRAGCPTEYENVTDDFSADQGVFARVVMRFMTGINLANATQRMKELVAAGNPDALRYRKWSGWRAPLSRPVQDEFVL